MSAQVVCIGPHILDVAIRPVTEIPAGQGGALLEETRISAAGTAAGTAVDLAKLGAAVSTIGAVGDDAAGRMLTMLMDGHGVDVSRLAIKSGASTSTTVLPIRPNGERPTLHLPGATSLLSAEDLDWELLARAAYVHIGGPDVLGEFGTEVVPKVLDAARAAGAVTTVDLLRTSLPVRLLDAMAAVWPLVDYFLPNDDQLRALTGVDDLQEAGRALVERGVGTVAVTAGADGSFLITEAGTVHIPAFTCTVVDTTGCGDAYTAGFVVGLQHGWEPTVAARLGTAAAALVAGGLGSDAGIVDLDGTLEFWAARAEEMGAPPPR
ncbi:PfkB family carbohydrate kinase [Mycolicibacterium smegmatis]|uniref:carbohydrate kinase family protein n=1 Tax=Mycolicibacterium smegmatis TaxID=1772 RepID=UPI001E3ED4A1|nr:PfkB family carbohydrate kinase [Mycolicibacterium smegmatis]UGU33128.1 PfkB family carbohydrate kinase [Mycolicibacterium smegmatis]ULN68006.1 carbohydrate kinase family protein [Mycolicibacterium smegmatis]